MMWKKALFTRIKDVILSLSLSDFQMNAVE